MTLVLAGGGTAGHVNPLLATAHELAGRGHRILVVGTATGMEKDLVPASGFDFATVERAPFPRRPDKDALRFPVAFPRAVRQARGEITIIRTGNNPYDDAAAALTCGSAPSGRQVRLRYVSGINLATDWGRLGGLTVEWAAQHISHEWIEVTDSAGRATFADLPVGLYLVDELAGDESAVGDPEKENSGCRRIAPFLVTLPVTEKGTWSYRLEITPKMINPAGPHPEPSPTAAPPTQPARPTPPTPSEPTAPPAEPQPSDQPQRTGWGFLTETGAAVEMLLVVSGALLGCGVVAKIRQRRERTGHR
ncbi:glycosyltransferase [Actinotignum timonense]|nr:glycosyltransferase [Actinotignum timonense]